MSRLIVVLAVLAAGSLLFGQAEETSTTRLLKSSEANQIAYLTNFIAEGIPTDTDDAAILVRNNPSLFVPMLEQKIEEIVRSPSPKRWFKSPSANPERVVDLLASMIEYTGEEIALEQAGKLMRIDESRFGPMVEHSLMNAYKREGGFPVAYRGFKIGDPAIDKRIIVWAEDEIGVRREPDHTINLREWAGAMVEEYKGAPDEYQWAKDLIVSRLSADRLNPPGGLPLHDEMFRLIVEAAQKRQKK